MLTNTQVCGRVCSVLSFFAILALITSIVTSPTFAQKSAPAAAAVPDRVTLPIDESNLVPTLSRNVHPYVTGQNDLGRVSDDLPMEQIILLLMRSPEQKAALDAMVDELHNPRSPMFHKWLTPQQIGRTYGPSDNDIAAITSWLQSHGFTIDEVPAGRTHIIISGTAGLIRSTFHTEIHNYMVNGEMHVANNSEPMIPAALQEVVQGFRSLHNFLPQPAFKPAGVFKRDPKTGKWYPKPGTRTSPQYGDITYSSDSDYFVGPQDWYVIYGENSLLNSGITGAGQTIAVIEETDINPTDVTTFRSQFNLPTYPATPNNTQGGVNYLTGANGACTDPGILNDGEEPEADLDVQWAGTVAPNATVDFVSCKTTSTTAGIDLAASYVINSLSSTVSSMSLSYGVCETELTGTGADGIYQADSFYNKIWEQAAAQGQTAVVSSGDSGSEGCNQNLTVSPSRADTNGTQVSGMESTPYNVSAGGLDYSDTFNGTNSTYWNSNDTLPYESALSYVPETPWGSYCANPLFLQYAITNDGFPSTETLPAFCQTLRGDNTAYDDVVGGSGGPSNCATGTPVTAGLVGGTCAGYAKPSWQSAYGVPADGVRDVPDLSFFAANGFWGHALVYCDSATDPCNYSNATDGTALAAGGTSFVAPQINGLMALVAQQTGSWQGQADYTLYAMAANEYGAAGSGGNTSNLNACNANEGNAIGGSCVFYDIGPTYDNATSAYVASAITQPCNTISGTTTETPCYKGSSTIGVSSTSNTTEINAWSATAGYDYASGIGSANVTNLVTNWNSYGASFATTTIASANPNTLTSSSQSTTLTGTVETTGRGGISAASGTVQFYIGSTSGTELGSAPLTSSCTGSAPNVVCTASGSVSVPATSLNGGSNSIVAYFGGDGANDAASSSSVTVSYVQAQTITCSTGAPSSAVYNSSFTLVCSASSGLPVAYTSSGACSNSGATYTMTSGTGTCTADVNQAGNASYSAAPQVQYSVTATPAVNTVTWTTAPPPSAEYGSSFTVAASGLGTGAISYTSDGVVCTNSGATYTMISSSGTCEVTATQAADNNYQQGSITTGVTAEPARADVSVVSGTNPSTYGQSVTFTATVNSDTGMIKRRATTKKGFGPMVLSGSVTWSANTGCAASPVSGNPPQTATCTTSALGGGSDTVTATYSDSNHNTGSGSVNQTVNRANPTVSFTGLPSTTPYNTAYTLVATTNASTTAVLTDNSPTVCSLSGSTVTIVGTSSRCSVTATWAADNNYNSATLTQSSATTKGVAVISWATPSAITYGTPLSGTQLDSTATPSNVYTTPVYSPGSGKVLDVGSQTLQVTYAPHGNSNYATTNDTVTLQVQQVSTTTTNTPVNQTVTLSRNGTVDDTIDFNVSSYKPTGTVQVTASGPGTIFCQGAVASSTGNGSCRLTFSQAGTWTITASYSGDANHTGSTSTGTTVTVKQ
jgi:subtilase family serine protease